MKKYFILLLIFGAFSCSKISPGGFWTRFNQSQIVSKEMDHGPYGGKTEIHWNAKVFSTKKIVEFAHANGFELVDSAKENLDFANQILAARFDESDLKNETVLYFKSNLMTINEDEKLETQINCFAILNAKKNKLTVYYRWGDF